MNPESQTVVIGHFDDSARAANREMLESAGFAVRDCRGGPDVLSAVGECGPCAVILEPLLPRLNGLSVLKRLKEEANDVAVIMLIDDGDTYTENRALICGADGIVRRLPDGSLPDGALVAKIRAVLTERSLGGNANDAEAAGDSGSVGTLEANPSIENPVVAHITDPVTGLFNRDYRDIKLAEEFKRARRFGEPLSVVTLQFKAGDVELERETESRWRRVLNEIAGLLLCESRDIDVLSRADAGTFNLILPNTGARGAETMAARILGAVAGRARDWSQPQRPFSFAAGIASYAGEGAESAEELVRRSESAVMTAWRSGGGLPVVWERGSEPK